MPDKLTDLEIKKALECCSIGTFACGKECPYYKIKSNLKVTSCRFELMCELSDLLNRQEEKIKLLEKYQTEFLKERLKTEELEEEIERLKAKANHYNYCYENFVNTPISRIKAEAYKEFAERLKEKGRSSLGNQFVIGWIDNLLKELVGEDK